MFQSPLPWQSFDHYYLDESEQTSNKDSHAGSSRSSAAVRTNRHGPWLRFDRGRLKCDEPLPDNPNWRIGTAPETTGIVTMTVGPVHDPNLRPERKTEKLDGKTIAGVYAEGTRLTVTYPVGFFGNDKPIITFHETWMSSDLKLVVLSVDDDPRTGTRITEVTNLDRGEPNPALFQVPEGYTIRDQYPGTN